MDNKPKLWITCRIFSEIEAELREHFDVAIVSAERPLSSKELAAGLSDCDAAMVRLSDHVGVKEVANAKRLRIIANLGVGFDNIDVKALTPLGIAVSNTPGVLNESVADFAWALILAAARRVAAADHWIRQGNWRQAADFLAWLGADLHGCTLGILGMGRIGRAIATRAQGFGMSIIYHNRARLDPAVEGACNARFVDKDTLVRASDVLILMVPRTPETYHAIGAAELAAMKSTAVLVNTSRGGIVDEAALAAALATGRIAAAALDVFEDEPTVHPALLKLDNVVLSPHIASASAGSRRAIARTAADNVLARFGRGDHAGCPPNVLNPETLHGE